MKELVRILVRKMNAIENKIWATEILNTGQEFQECLRTNDSEIYILDMYLVYFAIRNLRVPFDWSVWAEASLLTDMAITLRLGIESLTKLNYSLF